MYKVVKCFTDMQDNGHIYEVGDKFPRDGIVVSDLRLSRLASSANRQKTPLIVEVKDLAKSLGSVSPAQLENAEQETPFQKEEENTTEKKVPIKRKKTNTNK